MTVRKPELDSLAATLLVGCCLFWGFQQALVKLTLPSVPPVLLAAIRFGLATVLLIAWARLRGVPLLQRDGTLAAGALAGTLFALEFAGMYVGLAHTTVARVTIFAYCAPFWVALLLPLRVRSERLGPRQWLGLVIAFAAVVLAIVDRGGAAAPAGAWIGDGLAIAAGFAWGLTTVVIRSTRLATLSAEKLLLYQVAASALVLPPLSLALGESWQIGLTPPVVLSLAIQTVLGSFASYLLWMWLLQRYPVTRISAFTFLTPVFAVGFGFLFFDEAIRLSLLVALVGVAIGIRLVNDRRERRGA